MTSVNDIKQGDLINFQSLSSYDNTTWRGTVKGFCDYDIARGMDDVLAIHQQVKATNPDIVPVENLNFIMLKMQDNSAAFATVKVFALEWIKPGSLNIEDVGNVIVINVYNQPDSRKQEILNLLRSHGFMAG